MREKQEQYKGILAEMETLLSCFPSPENWGNPVGKFTQQVQGAGITLKFSEFIFINVHTT